ncbi:class I adenylate-forming enzyme family protein [Micromonospora eburnea]|uniref:Acyl-CoA synthetase (AMP-forming)/AMP-acid ligase II n=1 Tax=Micromonospora eburnea TaxID=227316 RepID=A0A1C6V0S4_9ACTN|nr:AMP-binding protein [Micromonospora eburnea]SCL59714.1 Acyl-CoA synthetase (AMP-forming)/AMP-acid ligase II [Micromonospora eburnea]
MRRDVDWVDRHLLAGADERACLRFDRLVTRTELRELVADRCEELAGAGLCAGGTVSLQLPPGLTYVVNLLAAWRLGAQVSLLDHRLTPFEAERAMSVIRPQLLVSSAEPRQHLLRGYTSVTAAITARDGDPAGTDHALLQLSSGSTGPSKVIGRTAEDLLTEIDRYRQLAGYPRPGERIVLLASMVHVLGLVGGLLYGLAADVSLVVPAFLTTKDILAAVEAGPEPATILGVRFHIDLLASVDEPPSLPRLARMIVGGEVVPPRTVRAFAVKYPDVPLGIMYGMTEVGVIATDLAGEHRPALAPVSGMALREESGQLLVARPRTPYVGAAAPGRWIDGWLCTRDAGTVDEETGLVTVTGRLDSQVSIAGLKVDLTDVEQTLVELPGVTEAVVLFDGGIEAFLAVADGHSADGIADELAGRLAAYKRPRRLHLLPKLPRTASGKVVRDLSVLRAAVEEAAVKAGA